LEATAAYRHGLMLIKSSSEERVDSVKKKKKKDYAGSENHSPH